jgi:hypothetical protein
LQRDKQGQAADKQLYFQSYEYSALRIISYAQPNETAHRPQKEKSDGQIRSHGDAGVIRCPAIYDSQGAPAPMVYAGNFGLSVNFRIRITEMVRLCAC